MRTAEILDSMYTNIIVRYLHTETFMLFMFAESWLLTPSAVKLRRKLGQGGYGTVYLLDAKQIYHDNGLT